MSPARAAWGDIATLARTYDSLVSGGGIDRAIAMADRVRAEYQMKGGFTASPRDLAACLAFECRTCQHCGVVPAGDDLTYLAALYEKVRATPPT